jgi:hypothetical protein
MVPDIRVLSLLVSVILVVVGEGIPLFPRDLPKRQFQFIKSEPFTSGLAQPTAGAEP